VESSGNGTGISIVVYGFVGGMLILVASLGYGQVGQVGRVVEFV